MLSIGPFSESGTNQMETIVVQKIKTYADAEADYKREPTCKKIPVKPPL